MKRSKIILVITTLALVISLAAILVGCSQVSPQKVLNSPWDNYEAITYDVTRILPDNDNDTENNPKVLGTQVVTTERINKGSIKIGTHAMDNFSGTVVTYRMKMDDGSYMNADLAFTSRFVPVASSSEVYVKSAIENDKPDSDIRQNINAKYEGREYIYSALIEELKNNSVIDSQVKEGVIKLKAWDSAPYVDSLMLYHMGRSSYSGTKGEFRPIAFNVPSWNEGVLKETSCNLAKNPNINVNIGETVYKTSMVGFAYTQKFPGPGSPLWAHYNTEEMEGLGKYVLIKMVENNIVYVYNSHTTTKA